MGGLVKGGAFKWQLDTILGKTSSDKKSTYANISRGGTNMTKQQRKDFIAREAAKGPSTTLSPLTDRYS